MKTTTSSAKRHACVLSRSIPAIPLIPGSSGETALGAFSRLPAGIEVQLCGDGFNTSTVKVHWDGGVCYVFLQDLPLFGR